MKNPFSKWLIILSRAKYDKLLDEYQKRLEAEYLRGRNDAEDEHIEALEREYQRGYTDGIDNHPTTPSEAFDTIMVLAQRQAQSDPNIKQEQMNKLVEITRHNYVLKPK